MDPEFLQMLGEQSALIEEDTTEEDDFLDQLNQQSEIVGDGTAPAAPTPARQAEAGTSARGAQDQEADDGAVGSLENLGRSLERGYLQSAAGLSETWAALGLFPEYFKGNADNIRKKIAQEVQPGGSLSNFQISFEDVIEQPLLSAEWFFNKVLETVPSTVPSIAAGLASGGAAPVAQAAGQFIINAPQTIGHQLGEAAHDGPEGQRRALSAGEYLAAGTSGMFSSGFESYADFVLAGRIANLLGKSTLPAVDKVAAANELSTGFMRVLREAHAQGKVEAATEGMQSVIENVGARLGWDPDRSISEGIIESIAIGYGAGVFVTGGIGGVGQAVQGRGDQEVEPEQELPTPQEPSTEQGFTTTFSEEHVQQEEYEGPVYTVRATDPEGNQIAEATFSYDEEFDVIRAIEANVDEEFRRQGIATALYDLAEKRTGKETAPSFNLSEDAKAFWEARTAEPETQQQEGPPRDLAKERQIAEAARERLARAAEQGAPVEDLQEEFAEFEADLTMLERAQQEPEQTTVESVTDNIISNEPVTDFDGLTRVGLTQGDVAIIRRFFGQTNLPKTEEVNWSKSIQGAILEGKVRNAEQIARGIIANPRVPNHKEHAAMVVKLAQLTKENDDLLLEYQQLLNEGRRFESQSILDRINNLNDRIDFLTQAGDVAGTEWGRAGAIRRMRIRMDQFSPTAILQRMETNRQGPATEEDRQEAVQLAQKVQKAQENLEKVQERSDELLEQRLRKEAEKVVKRESKKKSKAEEVAALESDAKEKLRRLGFRVQTMLGLDPEAAWQIGRLAIAKIRQGASTLDEVVTKVRQDLPELDPLDVYESLNARNPKAKRSAESDTQARIRELKTQARWVTKIEKMLMGERPEAAPRAPSSEEVKLLRRAAAEFEKTLFAEEINEEKLQRVVEKINDLKVQLEVDTPTPQSLQRAREIWRDLKSLKDARTELADLQAQLKGEKPLKSRERKPKRPRLPELEEARIELNLARKAVQKAIRARKSLGVGEKVEQATGAFRIFQATADWSAALRQGFILSVTRPSAFAKAYKGASKATFDNRYAELVDLTVKDSPMQAVRDKHGLYLSPFSEGALAEREELYASRAVIDVIEKIPGIGKPWAAVIKASERHMITFLNLLRSQVFDDFVRKNPQVSDDVLDAYAKYVNEGSGRGTLPHGAAHALSVGMFSPRFSISRLQVPYRWAQIMYRHPELRKAVARDMAGVAATGLAMLGIAQLAGVSMVLDDPDDPDWLKLRVGDTRIDMFGGLLQPMRLLFRMAMVPARRADFIKGKFGSREMTWTELGMTFVKFKLSPWIGIASTAASGRNVLGERKDLGEVALEAVTPLFMQDVYDAYKEEGLIGALVLPAAVHGISISSYGTELGKPDIKDILNQAEYYPQPPRYPEYFSEDRKEAYDSAFEDILAARIRANRSLLLGRPPEQKKAELQIMAAQARTQVMARAGIRYGN